MCVPFIHYILSLGETQKQTNTQTNLFCFPQTTSCRTMENLERLAFNRRTSRVNERTTKVTSIMYFSQITQNIKKLVENFVLPIREFFMLFLEMFSSLFWITLMQIIILY